MGEENIRTTSAPAGGLVFAGEPVLYSTRKLWIRLPSSALQRAGDVLPGGASDHDSVILPAISPPAMVESPEQLDIELPLTRQAAYVGISDFWPDRTDRRDWRIDDWVRACGTAGGSSGTGGPSDGIAGASNRIEGVSSGNAGASDGAAGTPDGVKRGASESVKRGASESVKPGASKSVRPGTPEGARPYYGLPSEARLCDEVVRLFEQKLKMPSVRGVSVDLRMVGIGEATDYLRFLRRVRKAAGSSRRLIASVPGEWFCRDGLPRKVYRAAVAGFAVEDMLESVDVVVVRCWRDPLLADPSDGALTSLEFTRAVIAAATRQVPCWKLAAGFMCGAAIGQESDPVEVDFISAQHLEELAQRYVVRRRYDAENDSLRVYLASRKLECDFWCEDAKTLPRKLAQVNRNNLVGVELFWPGNNHSLIDACRERIEPLQEFEGSGLNSSTDRKPTNGRASTKLRAGLSRR